MRTCPFCSEAIQDAAIKCRFCGEWLASPSERAPEPTGEVREAIEAAAHPTTGIRASSDDGLTYAERVRLGWMILWRWMAGAFVIGIPATLAAATVAVAAALDNTTTALLLWLFGLPSGVLVIFPFFVCRPLLRKRFKGYRLAVVRD